MRYEHSYSKLEPIGLPDNVQIEGEIDMPDLPMLVMKSMDPAIRPFSRVTKVYLFPEKLVGQIPPVDPERVTSDQLPAFASVVQQAH